MLRSNTIAYRFLELYKNVAGFKAKLCVLCDKAEYEISEL
jgi:hypothetical protein